MATSTFRSLSDFGTIHTFAIGLNWQPARIVSVTGNYTKRQNAPTASQLGDAIIPDRQRPDLRLHVTGQTVNIRTISGGNPNLDKGETQSFRVSAFRSTHSRIPSSTSSST
jgi:outer membrane receptor protein involved in Fe transport